MSSNNNSFWSYFWFINFCLMAFVGFMNECQVKILRYQALEYGWIENGFQGKDYPQIKLDKMKPIVTSQDKPVTVHFTGEVLDQMSKWHKFHIVIEPNWETKED